MHQRQQVRIERALSCAVLSIIVARYHTADVMCGMAEKSSCLALSIKRTVFNAFTLCFTVTLLSLISRAHGLILLDNHFVEVRVSPDSSYGPAFKRLPGQINAVTCGHMCSADPRCDGYNLFDGTCELFSLNAELMKTARPQPGGRIWLRKRDRRDSGLPLTFTSHDRDRMQQRHNCGPTFSQRTFHWQFITLLQLRFKWTFTWSREKFLWPLAVTRTWTLPKYNQRPVFAKTRWWDLLLALSVTKGCMGLPTCSRITSLQSTLGSMTLTTTVSLPRLKVVSHLRILK